MALGFIGGASLVGLTLLGVGLPMVPQRPFVQLEVHVNAATPVELESLPGIGPVLAKRIVMERNRSGRFLTLDDLSKVKGITPKTLANLKGLVRFD